MTRYKKLFADYAEKEGREKESPHPNPDVADYNPMPYPVNHPMPADDEIANAVWDATEDKKTADQGDRFNAGKKK